jgi:DNA-binding XRE family transcriptional regulator
MLANFEKELFTQKLKEFRGSRSQNDVADELDINRATLSLLENAKQLPSLEILNKICLKTNMPIDSFFIKEEQNSVLLMMGQLQESDRPKLGNVMERIKIREKYIAISKRCS